MLNKVILIGNVGSNPEIKSIKDTHVIKFSLATNESYKDKLTDEWKTITEWHQITKWGNVIGYMERIKKGMTIMVEGKIHTNEYTDQDGTRRRFTNIKADKIKIVDKKDHIKEKTFDPPTAETKNTAAEGDDDLPF